MTAWPLSSGHLCVHPLSLSLSSPIEGTAAPHIYKGSLGIATLRIITVVTCEPLNLRSSSETEAQEFEREDMSTMYAKRCAALVLLVVTVGLINATENYMDYGEEMAEKTPAENIHEFYRLLLQRNALDNAGFGGIPLEHLMIRKSQRSPSLRLRFGRSGPHVSAGALPRPVGYDNNN